MSTTIMDGTGSNYRVAVTPQNRIQVASVNEDVFTKASEDGRAFNLNTEAIAYSGTGPYTTGALYVKNNGAKTLEVVGFFIGEYNNRSGGNTTAPLLFEMFGNPTGTVSGTAVGAVNRQIGSAKSFDVTAYSEPTGWSVSGAPLLYQYQYSGRSFGTVTFSIPTGQSILIRITAQCDTFTAYTGFTGFISE